LYVADEGKFDVIQSGRVVDSIGPGEVFGEMAILYNCPRTASVRGKRLATLTDESETVISIVLYMTILLYIYCSGSPKSFMHLFLAIQDVRVWTLERVAYQQIMKTSAMRRFDERVGFLKSVPLMKDLNEEFLSKIADVLKEVCQCNKINKQTLGLGIFKSLKNVYVSQ